MQNLLKTICITGIFLLIITGSILVFSAIMGRGSLSSGPEADFNQMLFEFDRLYWNLTSNAVGDAVHAAIQETEKLEKLLDRMEKKSISADSLLSALKRRRMLSLYNPRYFESYRQATARAHKAYPHSESLTAIAAAAQVRGTAISGETESTLRSYIPYLSTLRTEALRLSLHVLLGDLESPHRAVSAMPGGFITSSVPYSLADREAMIINAALINIITGGSAVMEVQELLWGNSAENANAAALSQRALAFAADYYYDFGEMLTAAKLFSGIPTELALIRQADALWLAEYTAAARNIWNALSLSASAYQERALYNMALTDSSEEQAARRLRTLAALGRNTGDPSRDFGIIRHSRFLDAPQAIPVLEKEIAAAKADKGGRSLGTEQRYSRETLNALLELELLRRRTQVWQSGRVTGAAWLLLGNYPEDRNIYDWANWYFIHQRNYPETVLLLRAGARRDYQFPLSEAIVSINEGNFDNAEDILSALSAGGNGTWEAQANLARVMELRHAPRQALEYYEKASATVDNNIDASRIKFRIAQCHKSLGNINDVRRALESALELNDDNHSARLELSRIW